MKLIRLDDGKIGLVVVLPTGPHAIDIAASLGVFSPHEPLANGLLNGSFKDGGNWSMIVKNWAHLRSPLKRLARYAAADPEYPSITLRPLTEQPHIQGATEAIIAIEITDRQGLADLDPTGRQVMDRQFTSRREENTSPAIPSAGVAQIIDFLQG